MTARREVATLGGGCFWCLEAVFEQVRGVEKVVSGYAGGFVERPTYEQVCAGTTGHAEVVQVTFDPSVVSYAQLLEIFFTIHDPTTPDRQGADEGPQYRSIVLTHSKDQEAAVREAIDGVAREAWDDPIVTEVAPFHEFFLAESYHQGYFRRNPGQGYCRAVIAPKVAKFRAKWAPLLKPQGSAAGAGPS
ncbi:MAG TPA: peptide-methionine (S)-S-oxide reductase MsrA [Candidatus Thermoplasmatota archaeon]|nr:peptide-methionine (S)-S-oxide reductase MsrA [Candidatus Thermoplasmatota archaeon]